MDSYSTSSGSVTILNTMRESNDLGGLRLECYFCHIAGKAISERDKDKKSNRLHKIVIHLSHLVFGVFR